MEKNTFKKKTLIKVYCSLDEKKMLKDKSKASKLTMSKYLLNVGIGYEIKSLLDHGKINDLARINGDLGRLGGLLKLWLTHDARVAQFDTNTINALLLKIQKNQNTLRDIMKKVVRANDH